ncbi:hypothetical protein AC249_AIPGENE26562 [Exaiptasia diaphana]|nr:hypothetical protein AC249_AIPGENE26562 [Exaiptasia diaphana]
MNEDEEMNACVQHCSGETGYGVLFIFHKIVAPERWNRFVDIFEQPKGTEDSSVGKSDLLYTKCPPFF